MLIFMVVQLAGSAGTYPVEISPSFVAKIHYYLPFTYTVNAFRSTICGGREHPSGCNRSDRTDDHFLNINNPSVQPYGKKKETGQTGSSRLAGRKRGCIKAVLYA
ncbi:MAG: hypothetical protein ACLUPF_06050 [Dorea sp.]